MPQHIPSFDNRNQAIVAEHNDYVPLVYFNRVLLNKGESHQFQLASHESCVVPVSGSIKVDVDGEVFDQIGTRSVLWEGKPNGVYVPVDSPCTIHCLSDTVEVFIAGGIYDERLAPFAMRDDDIDLVQYGSDDTKTHRKIKHILGQKQHDKVGRLLVSELYTVGQGGWSGFPSHKHDTNRLPDETRHDETYNFRFKPNHGSGVQMLQRVDNEPGDAYHIVDGSTICLDKGYHPCAALPGYEMYYFTILGGLTQRSLVQYFQPTHAYQIETIPGIKDMIAKFK